MGVRQGRYPNLPSREQRGRIWAGLVRGLIVATVIAVCLFSSQLSALINPKFTPIHLTSQSQIILELLVGPGSEEGKLLSEVVSVVKGKAAKTLALAVKDELLIEILNEILEGQSVPAVMFVGSYSESDPGNVEVKANSVAFLSVEGRWFALARENQSNTWQLVEDSSDMRGVWDGSTEMLLRCVEYILAAQDNAQVPVRAGVSWDTKKKIAKVAGPVRDIMMVDLLGKGRRGLFVVSEAGDRFFVYDEDDKTFKDVSGDLGVLWKSKSVTFGDFNADGLVDIASGRGKTLNIWFQSERGRFGAKSQSIELGSDCEGINIMDVGVRGRAGMIVSTQEGARLVWISDDGKLMSRALGGLSKCECFENRFGVSKGSVVADFDGDGLADVLQAFAKGGLFYAGKGDGDFELPKASPDVYCGDGEVKLGTGDFDGDGKLDVIVFGKEGLFLWHNRGAGVFAEPSRLGAPDYIAKANMVDGAVCDVNGDGRQEFVAFYKQAGPHPFFSRGFFTFGFAGELDIMQTDFLPEAGAGQQAGLMADVNGDGVQDMILVLADGTIWLVLQKVARSPRRAVRTMLRIEDGFSGPITVSGISAGRCLGAWNVTAGGGEGFFARDIPGPIKLRWQFPAEPVREEQVILEESLERVFLGPGGIVEPSDTR